MALDSHHLQLEYEFLKALRNAEVPLGASTLVHTLGKKYELSQATIGRKLMEFDFEGYTVLEGRKGRILTEKGTRRIAYLEKELHQKNVNSQFLQLLNNSGESALLDVLVARRALEREIAALAAQRATKEEISLLEASIASQNELLSRNIIPYEEDREFHTLLALTARNQVLLHAAQLVWQTGKDFLETAYIRRTVGSELVVDHRKILDAVVAGSPEQAEAAMVMHINQMIEDVKRYYAIQNQEQRNS
ncbi:FCD domain-containing protein [Paenibacillus sp. IHBB 3054]|uniref:FadR/GntR family transcriptional regulator n=1 Tax=Paenibacillus sp. IHBB 3054 TaxID=3425689 RepID=UPI003F669637